MSVTLVVGAPGSGKTTYVEGRARKGDLIVNYDTLYSSLSGLPIYERADGVQDFALSARRNLMYNIMAYVDEGSLRVNRAWVVTSTPSRVAIDRYVKEMNADVHMMGTPQLDCLLAVSERPRLRGRRSWEDLVNRWFDTFEPDPRWLEVT